LSEAGHVVASTSEQPGELIAGRYRVVEPLAVGGMGEVLVVLDTSLDRRLALKRLLQGGDARATVMFEREYQTLVGLKHPRIVEVYDYGIDDGRRYYTMELLDGHDLRKSAPLPFKVACRYLRDIASSLSLLHARGLLHRDVSPRNVHVTRDDRCKLLDFGALASFGVMEVIVGTPPYLAPEAVKGQRLDQRADLFSLGAVAYWLLTGKHAFPARTLRDLPALWSQGAPRPSEALRAEEQAAARETPLPPIPKALDELVMSLLTPDPLGRPESAMEVIDRLSILAELPPDQDVLSRSYLHGAQTVGRERERSRLRKRLERCLKGAGSSMIVDAAPGMGSTRVIADIALDAQLAGAIAISVDAKLHQGLYGVAHALADALVIALPQQSVEAATTHADQLARFSPALAARLPSALDPGPLPPGELRRRVQVALADWLFELAARKPLLLAIDNAQELDEASAALLATIARAARYRAIMIVVVRKPGPATAASAAMRATEEAGGMIELRALTRAQVHDLLLGVFGDVPNVARLADWLHSFGAGNPQACLSLVRHLVDSDVIRFKAGVWVLPQELRPEELPADLGQALDARSSRLEHDARVLAEALSVHRGALSNERCLKIARAEGLADPSAALQALEREEIVAQQDGSVHFVDERMRERLYAQLPSERQKALHRGAGRMLSANGEADTNAMLEAGWHLLHGGAEREGASLLAEAGTSLTHGADEIAASVPALRAALAVFKKEKRPKHELARVLAPLAIAGYRVDRRLGAEYGDEAIDVLRDLIGLKLSAVLRPWLGAKLSLYLGLAFGVVRALLTHGVRGIETFRNTVSTFFTCVVSLASAATICFDIERTKQCVRAIEPLAALGPDHPAAISYRFAKNLSRLPEDRVAEVAAGCEELIARLGDATRPVKGLPEDSRLLLLGGAWYALGAMSCFRDGPYALKCADRLDALGLRLYAMAADQVRTMYHGLRGDIARAKRYRERVEMHAIQSGSGWQVEIWSPCGTTLVYTLTRDVIGIKRVAEEIDRLLRELPTLARHHQLARGVYHELKGDLEVAVEIRRAVLAAAAPRAFIGYPPAVGSHAATLTALGRAQEAKQCLQAVLDGMTPADEPYIAMYQKVFTSLAIADAALGDFAAATQRLDALIEQHAPAEGPLTLGNLHAARARVALMMQDVPAAERHLTAMERWFRPTGNPALIAQCEGLRREIAPVAGHEAQGIGIALTTTNSRGELDTLRSVLGQCSGQEERGNRALELIVTWAHAAGGHLYLCEGSETSLRVAASSVAAAPPPVQLESEVIGVLQDALDAEDEATSAVDASDIESISIGRGTERVQIGDATYHVFVLSALRAQQLCMVGAAVVRQGDEPIQPPSSRLLDAVSRALLDATPARA
jgi:tRNA A-37 threonylcarbamoyl transferase component Bud32